MGLAFGFWLLALWCTFRVRGESSSFTCLASSSRSLYLSRNRVRFSVKLFTLCRSWS